MKSKIASLSASFERLSGREQVMVLFLVLGLLTMFLGVSSFMISRDLTLRRARVDAKTEQLKQLGALKTDYQRRLAEQNQLADQIRQNNEMRLLSYIEDVSKAAAIDLSNASERGGESTSSDVLREEAAEVVIQSVSIDRLYDFLNRIEDGNRLVRIRRLKVKSRFDNPKRLEATVTIGTFKLKS